jgi:hypothetical protein
VGEQDEGTGKITVLHALRFAPEVKRVCKGIRTHIEESSVQPEAEKVRSVTLKQQHTHLTSSTM